MHPRVTDSNTVYRRNRVVRSYRRNNKIGLWPVEQQCLGCVPPSHRGSVLDIGVGTGRTTGPLSAMFGDYVGIDISPEMVATAQQEHPDKALHVMDVRELTFERQFDRVVFMWNAIDLVDHADRERVFSKISSVLRPDGYFIYSTHNLHYHRVATLKNNFFVKELFSSWKMMIEGTYNRARLFSRQWVNDTRTVGYINDFPYRFSFLGVCVDIRHEIDQWKRRGHSVVTAIGNKKPDAGFDHEDDFVFIVTQRQAPVPS